MTHYVIIVILLRQVRYCLYHRTKELVFENSQKIVDRKFYKRNKKDWDITFKPQNNCGLYSFSKKARTFYHLSKKTTKYDDLQFSRGLRANLSFSATMSASCYALASHCLTTGYCCTILILFLSVYLYSIILYKLCFDNFFSKNLLSPDYVRVFFCYYRVWIF